MDIVGGGVMQEIVMNNNLLKKGSFEEYSETFIKERIFNIKANAISEYKDVLSGYKVTPKGMLQIFLKQEIPVDVLRRIFAETLI